MRKRGLKQLVAPWLFIMPFILLFVVFTAFPLLFSLYLSFLEWNPVAGLDAMRYVGLDNYRLAMDDPWFWKSVYNTLWLGLVSGISQHLIAIPVAYCLVAMFKGAARHIFTAVLFVPFITSTVAVSLIFYTIFSAQGVMNEWLLALSGAPVIGYFFSWVPDALPIRWLSKSDLIKPTIAFVVIWKYTGFNIVIYSAGFLTVSKDLYDAAKVDGCNRWQQFWHVALPVIRPFVFFAVTLSIIGGMQLFEEPYVLTAGLSGGVSQAGLTTSYYLCLLYTSPSPRDQRGSRMPSSA